MTEERELSLDDLDVKVEGDKPEETKEVETVEAEAEAPETTEATEEQAAPPAAEEKDQSWHLKAVLDEREKRQAAQREAQELRDQLEALKKGEEQPKTSVFEDEAKFRTELLTDVTQREWNNRLEISQGLAEDKWGAEKVAKATEEFKVLAKENPDLLREVQSAKLPYYAVVGIVDRHEKAKALEKLTAPQYEAEMKAKIRAEVEAELKAKHEAEDAKRESITPSLASRRSAGGVKASDSLIGLDDIMP